MGYDCLPKGDGEKVGWLSNYRDQVALLGESLELGLDEALAMREEIDAFLAAHDNLSQLKKSLAAAINFLRQQERELTEKLRAQIARVKSAAGYTDQIGRQLRIEGEVRWFDPDKLKPTFKLLAEAGCVRVDFVKGEADAVNIYSRTPGETRWRFVACDTNSPYMDCSVPAPAESSGVREYMLRGVLNEEEIGHASETVTAFCGETIRNNNSTSAKRVGRWA